MTRPADPTTSPSTQTAAPSISVIMIDGSFRECFHTLDSLAHQSLPRSAFEIIWVEHFDQLSAALTTQVIALPNCRAITLNRQGVYHSSFCFNAGIAAARGDLIVIPDGDLVLEEDFLSQLWALHQDNSQLVTYCHRFNEPEDQHTETTDLLHLRQVAILTHPFNWGGCVAARRRWFTLVNGYEQLPLFASGDHGNDFDMYVRFKNLGLHVCWPKNPVLYHPWHPGTLRYSDSHRLQAVVTRYRAHQLSHLAFQGLDPSQNIEVPETLTRALEAAARDRKPDAVATEAPPFLVS